jgi:hypothetical protein
MKKIILTIATAMISVFAMAQEVMYLPSFAFTGSAGNYPLLEIKFFDQFSAIPVKDINQSMLEYKSPLPFQIACVNFIKYVDGNWQNVENLFFYEDWRKTKNGGQLSMETMSAYQEDGTHWYNFSNYSELNPRQPNTGLLMKKVEIYMESVNFEWKGEQEIVRPIFNKEIECHIRVVSTTLDVSGNPYKVYLDEVFKGYLTKIDEFGNYIP